MKFCVDCKHCVLDNKYKMCKKGGVFVDRVNGRISYVDLCNGMRENACGEEAKFFEPTLWYQVQTFFIKS